MQDEAPSDLTLQALPVVVAEPSARRVTRSHYSKHLVEYEPVYGYKVRNFKKWLHVGREADPIDLPPLDAPADMPAWWKRRMKQRCPDRILASAAAVVKADGVPTPPEASDSPPPSAAPPMPASDDEALQGTGYAAMLARAVNTERLTWQSWQDALKAVPYNPADEEQRRHAYNRASEQARKVLKDRDIGLAGDEKWGQWEEFETLAEEHVAVLNQSLRGVPIRVATKLTLAPDMFRRMDEAWNAELDRIFDNLAGVDWRKSLDSEEEFQLDAA